MKNFTLKLALILVMMGAGIAGAYAQQVKGTVKDAAGTPVVGASVIVKGTTTGTTTDATGGFELNVHNPDATLQISYIGLKEQEIVLNGRTQLNIDMQEDATLFDDVVVIGYGTQKRSVVTAAISSVTGDDLKKIAPVRIEDALKGMVSGVSVTAASGQPGSASQVRIRGVGTVNNSDPLYIVDGMIITGGVDFLNPRDIERTEILKDAASCAVYGARGANGVILVTTKRGQKGDASVSYDFSYGWQNPWRKPSVLNATEYATLMNEGYISSGQNPMYADPYSLGKGTDWVDAVFDKGAPVMQHNLSISGASDNINYMVSAGYYTQDGIIGGSYGRSNYDRITLHSNTQYKLFDRSKQRDWLNKLTLGVNLSYARILSTGIQTNSEYGGPLGSAMGMSPLLDIYASDAEIEELMNTKIKSEGPNGDVIAGNYLIRDKDGRAYSIAKSEIYNEMTNPLAQLSQPATKNNSDKFVSNFTADLQLYKGLSFRSSVGTTLSFWGSDGYAEQFYMGSKNYNLTTVAATDTYDKDGNKTTVYKTSDATSVWSEMNRGLTWLVENVLTYNETFGERHHFSAMIGQSAMSDVGSRVGGSRKGLIEVNPDKANIDFCTGNASDGDQSVYGYHIGQPYRLTSYFARVSYNYDERYMIQAIVRRDASSLFGPNNRWATFPSVSAGWTVSNEKFMRGISKWFSMLKLRASWGINGNDQTAANRYTVNMGGGNNGIFGSGGNKTETIVPGFKPNGFANPNLKWEESTQTDIGLDMGFFRNALTFTIDYYKKRTDGMLMEMPIPGYAGDSAPWGNVGLVDNSGVEMEINYRFSCGDFNFRVGGNATYLSNKLVELGNANGWANYASHKIGTLTRGQNGLPYPFFYGYKTAGIFQNSEQINAYVNSKGESLQPNAQPGDVRFVDYDGNGKINDDDRTMIGKGLPDWTFGLNFGFEWKGLDFNAVFYGVAGAEAFNVSRRTDLYYINLPSYMMNRWTGEGTSDKLPRFTFDSKNENWRASDLWVEDASFLRLRNLQVGYTLPRRWTAHAGISKLRVYFQGENLFTLTKYRGCDPELSSGGNGGGTTYGLDRGVYPQARVLTIGANITF